MGGLELELAGGEVGTGNPASGYTGIAVSDFDFEVSRLGRGFRDEEAEGMELSGVMPERVGAAAFEGDDQFIGLHSFGDNDIKLVIGIGRDADAATLSDGVSVEAAVGTEVLSLEVDDGAGLIGDVGGEEIVYLNLADEADALAILFIGIGKAELAGGPTDFGFGEKADGEDGV